MTRKEDAEKRLEVLIASADKAYFETDYALRKIQHDSKNDNGLHAALYAHEFAVHHMIEMKLAEKEGTNLKQEWGQDELKPFLKYFDESVDLFETYVSAGGTELVVSGSSVDETLNKYKTVVSCLKDLVDKNQIVRRADLEPYQEKFNELMAEIDTKKRGPIEQDVQVDAKNYAGNKRRLILFWAYVSRDYDALDSEITALNEDVTAKADKISTLEQTAANQTAAQEEAADKLTELQGKFGTYRQDHSHSNAKYTATLQRALEAEKILNE